MKKNKAKDLKILNTSKLRSVRNVIAGKSSPFDEAEYYDVSVRTIYRWLEKYDLHGEREFSNNHSKTGRKKKLTDKEWSTILSSAILDSNDFRKKRRWVRSKIDPEVVVKLAKKRFKKEISVSTVYRYIKESSQS